MATKKPHQPAGQPDDLEIEPHSRRLAETEQVLKDMFENRAGDASDLTNRIGQVMFSHLMKFAPDANLLIDGHGAVLAANPQAEVLFGYGPDDLTGVNIGSLVLRQDDPESSPTPDDQLLSHAVSGIYDRIFTGVRKNQHTFSAELAINPVVLSGRQYAVCLVRDISNRILAEQALREQTGYVRLLQDIAVAANEAESVDGAMQFALDRICEFTGWPVGHAIYHDPRRGLYSSGLWHLENPGQQSVFQQASETTNWNAIGGLPVRIMHTGQANWIDDIMLDPDFRRKRAARTAGLKSAFTFPLLINKEAVGVLEFFSTVYTVPRADLLEVMRHIGTQLGRVIERERGRRALQRSESRFRAIFEESTIGIQLNDLEGHFIEINPAMQAMLGYSPEELRLLGVTEVIHPGDLAQNVKNLDALLRGELAHYETETRYLRKDGSTLWAQLAVSLIYDAEMRPQFVVTLVVDVSQRKNMEAELTEVQSRLQESVEAERMRLAMELHDGPLQDLYGAIFQLQEIMPSLSDTASSGAARSALTITQQVISSLRTTVGDLRPPTLIPFGLEKAIRSHIDRWQQIYPNVAVHLDLMSDGVRLSRSGRLALFRAYQQLISNVARHSQAKNVWVRLKLTPEEIILEVQDDGAGFSLPPRWVELAREGHTGLIGISERLESFGGSLWVETQPDQGTLVHLTIPFARMSANPEPG